LTKRPIFQEKKFEKSASTSASMNVLQMF